MFLVTVRRPKTYQGLKGPTRTLRSLEHTPVRDGSWCTTASPTLLLNSQGLYLYYEKILSLLWDSASCADTIPLYSSRLSVPMPDDKNILDFLSTVIQHFRIVFYSCEKMSSRARWHFCRLHDTVGILSCSSKILHIRL